MIIKVLFLLIVGFILLIKASDIFVDAISSIAVKARMSKMMIALTVAAFGTCAPELAISFNSMASGNGNVALANVVGSNVINILLIVGLAAFINPIKVKSSVTKKELPILLSITGIFCIDLIANYIFKNSYILNRLSGLLFVSFFVLFMSYIVSLVKSKQGRSERSNAKYKLSTSIFLTIACCVVIVYASDMVVDNACALARMLNVSEKIITMTFIVIGTSLPEMTMTVISARKREFDIALGNIIGTNIFNIGVVLGLPLLIYGGFSANNFNLVDTLAVLVAAYLLYYFCKNDKVLSRKEGIVMLLVFSLYYLYLFLV